MAPQTQDDESAENGTEMAKIMANIADRSQRLVSDFIARNASGKAVDMSDSAQIGAAFLELTQKMMQDPAKMVEAQVSLWERLHESVAQYDTAHAWPGSRTDHRTRKGRPAL